MQLLLIICGLTLLGLTSLDVLWTTIAVGQSGEPITNRICSQVWEAALRCHRRLASHHFLTLVGYGTILLTTFTWIVLTFVGWVLKLYSIDTWREVCRRAISVRSRRVLSKSDRECCQEKSYSKELKIETMLPA